jgi:hypothetical protein
MAPDDTTVGTRPMLEKPKPSGQTMDRLMNKNIIEGRRAFLMPRLTATNLRC